MWCGVVCGGVVGLVWWSWCGEVGVVCDGVGMVGSVWWVMVWCCGVVGSVWCVVVWWGWCGGVGVVWCGVV